eukprot:CAMPEP_0113584094 /NCGR_PEP_ID=MMETSP0015_2-20120614/32905_1 /TAXON_ID=2838 /ORGANISM="Odontella" /LENGTH=68 /DNA_ID=CAMNT_0000489091 /DNA_START=32 /DNA_END=235 /DNA_ORIENTATION=- /assembly_acc=CAM_ASM_000160
MKSSAPKSLLLLLSLLGTTCAFSVQSQLSRSPASTALSAATPLGGRGGGGGQQRWNPFEGMKNAPEAF